MNSQLSKQPAKLPAILSNRLAYLFIFIGTALFSIKAIFIKFAYQYGVNANTLLCLRMLLALPFYVAMLFYMHKKYPEQLPWKSIVHMALVGCLGYFLASLFDLHSLRYISVGLERMILYTYPGIVLILSMIFFDLKPTLRDLLALVVAFIGIVIVFYQDIQLGTNSIEVYGIVMPEVAFGTILCFIGACLFAVYFVNSEKLIKRYSSQRFTALAMIGASAAVFTHFILNEPWSLLSAQQPAVYGYALAIAFFSTVLPSFLISAGVQVVGASKASLLAFMGPTAAIFAAWIFLDEPITLFHIIGFSVVLVGMAILGNIKGAIANKFSAKGVRKRIDNHTTKNSS